MPNNQATPPERPAETLGNRLRNTRTSLGKSLKEAAQVTCINPTILANLESDNFTKMPAEVFTRGFIKLYAQYLGLDAGETLDLYINQESLDPERPAEQPYRREILTGAAMATPLRLFRSNPRLRIIAILLTLLLGFYVLGAILKVGQKPPDQTTPENELAQSLVDGNNQPLTTELTAAPEVIEQTEMPRAEIQPITQPEVQTAAVGAASPVPPGTQPFKPATAMAGAAGQPVALPPAETVLKEITSDHYRQPSAQLNDQRRVTATGKSGPPPATALEETAPRRPPAGPAAIQ